LPLLIRPRLAEKISKRKLVAFKTGEEASNWGRRVVQNLQTLKTA
jgi:hypothetical protein